MLAGRFDEDGQVYCEIEKASLEESARYGAEEQIPDLVPSDASSASLPPTLQDCNIYSAYSSISGGSHLESASHSQEICSPPRFPSLVPKDEPQKRVSFGFVKIHYHSIILGDNPACSEGPPIQIGWKAFATKNVCVDHFEKWREGHRRCGQEQLALNAVQRRLLLRKTGVYESREIFNRIDEMQRIKKERRKSNSGRKWKMRFLNIVGW